MKVRTPSIPAIFIAALVGAVSAQPSPPAEGVQLSTTRDVRFPSNLSQCDPIFIYYDRANATDIAPLGIYAPENVDPIARLIRLAIPAGIGYIEWVCNIPAGHGYAVHYDLWHYGVVQSGPSVCLGDVTTTYPILTYTNPSFQSYTANPPNTAVPSLSLATRVLVFCFLFPPCKLELTKRQF